MPTPKLVTAVFESPGEAKVPLPDTIDQVPIPSVGELPASTVVAVLEQMV
jgi:hypothetical protein